MASSAMAQIGGFQVLPTRHVETNANKICSRSLRAVRHFYACLSSRSDRSTYTLTNHGYFDREKNPKYPYARIKMAQVLRSPLYICGRTTSLLTCMIWRLNPYPLGRIQSNLTISTWLSRAFLPSGASDSIVIALIAFSLTSLFSSFTSFTSLGMAWASMALYLPSVVIVILYGQNWNISLFSTSCVGCKTQWRSEDVRGPWTTDYPGPLPHTS